MKKLTLSFEDDGFIPNSRFPVLLNRKDISFRGMDTKEAEAMLKERALKVGWNQDWLWKVYKRPHYHSTTHEALVVFGGSATLRFGGHRVGKLVKVSQGDTVVIPAGVAHQNMGGTENFQVFGLYPVGAEDYDMRFCRKWERAITLPRLASHEVPPDFTL